MIIFRVRIRPHYILVHTRTKHTRDYVVYVCKFCVAVLFASIKYIICWLLASFPCLPVISVFASCTIAYKTQQQLLPTWTLCAASVAGFLSILCVDLIRAFCVACVDVFFTCTMYTTIQPTNQPHITRAAQRFFSFTTHEMMRVRVCAERERQTGVYTSHMCCL